MTSIRVHPSRPRSPQYPPSYELNETYPQTSAVNADVLPEVTNAVPLAYDNTNLDNDSHKSVCFIFFAFGFIAGLIIGLVI